MGARVSAFHLRRKFNLTRAGGNDSFEVSNKRMGIAEMRFVRRGRGAGRKQLNDLVLVDYKNKKKGFRPSTLHFEIFLVPPTSSFRSLSNYSPQKKKIEIRRYLSNPKNEALKTYKREYKFLHFLHHLGARF